MPYIAQSHSSAHDLSQLHFCDSRYLSLSRLYIFFVTHTVDAAVRPVRASAHLRCALARHMLHSQVGFGQMLVFSVGLGVSEQVKECLCSLLRPAALVAWSILLLALLRESVCVSVQQQQLAIITASRDRNATTEQFQMQDGNCYTNAFTLKLKRVTTNVSVGNEMPQQNKFKCKMENCSTNVFTLKLKRVTAMFRWAKAIDLCMSADASCKHTKRDSLFFLQHVLQVFHRGSQAHALDGVANFTAMLKVHALVGHACLAGCGNDERVQMCLREILSLLFYEK